jgi:alanine racemase
LEIQLSKTALRKNIESFKSLLNPNVLFAAVVKSNAYGHGILEIAKLSLEYGANVLAVNSIDEALLLKENFPNQTILIMGEISDMRKRSEVLNYSHFWIVCSRIEQVRILHNLSNRPKIHLKVDTGMSRLGYRKERFSEELRQIKSENLELQGLLTHFASAEDFTEHSYSLKQLQEFKEAIGLAEELGFKNLIKHTSSSASTMLFPEAHFDMVRIGISLYGVWASLQTKLSLSLRGERLFDLFPVLSWKTNIVHIQEIPSGTFIGYGSTYKTNHPTKLAVIPVGYYEGIDRRLSNIGYFLVKGERARIIGRVCMNMCMIDITPIENINIGEEVILIGNSEKETLYADSIADLIGTINYEVLTNINANIKRIIVD